MTVYVLQYIGMSIHGYVFIIRINNTTLVLYIPKSYIFTFLNIPTQYSYIIL